ncbi:MAG: S8 family serine peptidase [Kastovskya adunca ATA6-11-RM4]|nr:S8 family serine peptidase [Kastovskya adunca ATA6-11-RM4]
MKRLVSSVLLTSCLWGSVNLSVIPQHHQGLAQAQTSNEQLFYTFYGQQIPLSLRSDVVAVAFKSVRGGTRGEVKPLYLQLQEDLQQGGSSATRGESRATGLAVDVKPLGDRFALVTLPSGSRSSIAAVTQQVRAAAYVQETLPVLSRSSSSEASSDQSEEAIVLPNEIVVSFEPGISEGRKQLMLMQNKLEVIRPLRFTNNRYLVRSTSTSGTAVLDVANRLSSLGGVQSATPNFVQSVPYQVQSLVANASSLSEIPNAVEGLQRLLARLPQPKNTPFSTAMLPLQWHLNSTPRRGQLLPRTDVRATESWKNSNQGEGVVVAVIDSLIQWDHPDLAKNVYESAKVEEPLPGEVHGWDFSSGGGGDPDTRLSEEELDVMRPDFQKSFALSSDELLKEYPRLARALKSYYPDASRGQLASMLRNYLRSRVASEFHGTWSAGVIAANPQDNTGVVGVAPHAKFLPVRVFGLGGQITPDALIEAVGYSAARDVDVINMSLGGLLPVEDLTQQIFEVLEANPQLAIVASAGNESLDGVGFPAAIPGVISVGATNLTGNRSFYSSYGGRLDVVAPGGDISTSAGGGILTTGGTGVEGFWEGISLPDYSWGVALDPLGNYVQVQGTSFSAPTVSGVVALMKGENGGLSRDRVSTILQETSNYEGLTLTKADENHYRLQAAIGFGTAEDFSFLRPSGIFQPNQPVSAQQYFFGSGLVNAQAAVEAAKR